MNYGNKKFDNWINKHQIHIFDNRFSGLGTLLCLPILYLESVFLRPRLSKTTVVIILVLTIVVLSNIFAQVIGTWWHKRRLEQLKSKGYKF